MKAYKVDYCQNQHLLDALIKHAEDLGYVEASGGVSSNRKVNNHWPHFDIDDGEFLLYRDEPDTTVEAFFRLTKEDVNPIETKELTMNELNALAREKFGYEVKIKE